MTDSFPPLSIPDQLYELCRHHGAVPLQITEDTLTIAVSEAPLPQRDKQLSFATGRHIELQIWSPAQLEAALNPLHSTDDHATAPSSPLREPTNHYPGQNEGETSVIQFIDQVIDTAIQRRASDIHFEPHAEQLHVESP